MTDEERSEEGAEEAIEDLDAPAAAQEDVAGGFACGGMGTCTSPSNLCQKPSVGDVCMTPTCKESKVVVKAAG